MHPEILLQLARSEIHDRLSEAAFRQLGTPAQLNPPMRPPERIRLFHRLLHNVARRPTLHRPLTGPTSRA